MTTLTRTDVHRPSVIVPEDYEFVGCNSIREHIDDVGKIFELAEQRRRIEEHRAQTGGKYSGHYHGGSCHVCGAMALDLVVWYHLPTNSYICTGEECAEKLGDGDPIAFRAFRDGVKSALECRAGKRKARELFDAAGLIGAWDLAHSDDPTGEPLWKCRNCDGRGCVDCECQGVTTNTHGALVAMVKAVIRCGYLDEERAAKIRDFAGRVENYQQNRAAKLAQWEAEKAAAEPCPSGRQTIRGQVIKTECRESQYGTQYKMTVKDNRGFIVWGSIPDSLNLFDVTVKAADGETWPNQETLKRGDVIEFTATVEPSDRDAKFGFHKRPTKARVISLVPRRNGETVSPMGDA